VQLFASSFSLLSETPIPATQENIQKAWDMVAERKPLGGTEILPALRTGINMPLTPGYSKTIVIITDGFISVEAEVFDVIRSSLGKANVFAFGIGPNVNRFLIEGMARAGNGEPFMVDSEEEAVAAAEKFKTYIASPVLTNVGVVYKDMDTYGVEPPVVPDVFAEKPIVQIGRFRGDAPKGAIVLTGKTATGDYFEEVSVAAAIRSASIYGADTSALRILWARTRVAVLDDYAGVLQGEERDSQIRQVTAIGLDYGLLTAYTSFVAVDSEPVPTGACVKPTAAPVMTLAPVAATRAPISGSPAPVPVTPPTIKPVFAGAGRVSAAAAVLVLSLLAAIMV